jgi:hypothetical protein
MAAFTISGTGTSTAYGTSSGGYVDVTKVGLPVKREVVHGYDMFKHLDEGDYVIVSRVDHQHGWEDEMDEMLDRESEVREVTYEGVRLYHYDSGEIYIFPFKSVDLLDPLPNKNPDEIVKTEMILGKVEYRLKKQKSVDGLKTILLPQDHKILKEIFNGRNYFSLEEELFKQIKEKCPRVIGALLSRQYLARTSNE